MAKQLDIWGTILLILAYRIAPLMIGLELGYIELQWVASRDSTSFALWVVGPVAAALMVWAAVRYPHNRLRPAAVAVTLVLVWQILFVAWSLKIYGIEPQSGATLAAYIAAGVVILVCSYMVYFTSWGKANFNNWRSYPGICRTKKL